MQVRAHAFDYPNAPPQAMTLIVNGHAHGPVPIEADWHTVEFLVDRSVWRSGVNHARIEFGRANRPADLGLGGDSRLLTAAFDFFRVMKPE